jgi:hypothetical protein
VQRANKRALGVVAELGARRRICWAGGMVLVKGLAANMIYCNIVVNGSYLGVFEWVGHSNGGTIVPLGQFGGQFSQASQRESRLSLAG